MNVLLGYNDTLAALFILAAALSWQNRRYLLSGALLGLMVATKQTTWTLVPLWGFWIWQQVHRSQVDRKSVQQTLVAASITGGLLYLPFLLWNAPAMYDDMFRYLSGVIPHSLPIAGFTFAQYLTYLRVVSGPWTTASIFPLTVLAFGLVSWWAIIQIQRKPNPILLLSLSSVVMLTVILFNRIGADNYLIPVFILALASFILTPTLDEPHV